MDLRRRWNENPGLPLTALTVVGTILRLYHLTFKAISFDEGQLYLIARGTIRDMLATNAWLNSAPPVYPILLWISLHLGQSEFFVRLPTVLAGIAAIPLTYLLARQWLSALPSLFAAALVAFSPTQIQYSQEARVYSIVVCFAALTIWGAVRFLKAPSWGRAVVWGAATAVALLTHYGFAIVAAGVGLVSAAALLDDRAPAGTWARWAAAQVIGLLGAGGVVPLLLGAQGGEGVEHLGPGGYLVAAVWNGSRSGLAHLAVTNTEGLLDFMYPTVLPVVLAVIGLVAIFRGAERKTLLGFFAVPFLLTFLGAIVGKYPYIGMRQDLHLSPMYYVLAAAGLAYLASNVTVRAIPLVIALFTILYGARYSVRWLLSPGIEQIKPVIHRLWREYRPGDVVYAYYGASFAFRYYNRQAQVPWVAGLFAYHNPARVAVQIDSTLASGRRTWFLFSHTQPNEQHGVLRYVASKRPLVFADSTFDAYLYLAK